METFWNYSTSVRNPERLPDFLRVAALLDGREWNRECQKDFQTMLIQHRLYLDTDNAQSTNKLSAKQKEWLLNKTHEMTFAEAKAIFDAKQYQDPPMRGRQSMNPLSKLGYMLVVDGKLKLTDAGKKLLDGTVSFQESVLDSLLKYQLPNHTTEGYKGWNIKPFISTLRLIKRVNELCEKNKQKVKGISLDELGIFVLSLKDYGNIESTAKKLLAYRAGFEKIRPSDYKTTRDYEAETSAYTEAYIEKYLSDFNNPVKNVHEYGDSMKRYIRQTKYIRILGKYAHQYIDLEPRRMIEIDAILQSDNGSCKEFTEVEWVKFMGTYGAYELPFETIDSLTKILNAIISDIRTLEQKLGLKNKNFGASASKDLLKTTIELAREYRIDLQNREIKFDYSRDTSRIDKAIEILRDIAANRKENLVNKLPVELEKWTNVALNIINDAINIKPNAPVGDDNEPTFTAPANVPDIECYYGSFGAICEVTMLKGRDQWYNEGQPVMRHLRDFEIKNNAIPNYCLFIAPSLHEDTLETYWTSVKHGYKGEQQKIVPMTIKQLSDILGTVKYLKESGRNLCRNDVMALYNRCTDLSSFNNSSHWPEFINTQLSNWASELLTVASAP